jgi:hypothetical protein
VNNAFGSVTSSVVSLVVNLPPVADASATKLVYVSANGTNATVILNGSRSSDPDGDPLLCSWYETGQANPLANGVVAVVALTVGSHPIQLVVSDGLAPGTNAITVEVLTPAQAVKRLEALLGSSVCRSRSLEATLEAALASIERGKPVSAVNQLEAFQRQVRAQVARGNPALAETLIHLAQDVIDALNSARTNPCGDTRCRISALTCRSDGHVWLQFAASSGQSWIVEASTNLVNWEKIGVAVPAPDGNCEFDDAQAMRFPSRYYRVVSPGSPAIDKGTNFTGSATDHRGQPRTYDNPGLANAAGGDGTDIGAVEFFPPALAITPNYGNVVLSWFTSDPGYTVESTAVLPNSGSWTPVPGTPSIIGNQYLLTNGPVIGNKFYRLKAP